MSVKILQEEYKAYLKSTIRELAAYKIAYEEKVKHKIEAEIRLDSDDRLYVSRLQLTATRLQGFESFFNGALSDAQVEPVHIEDNLCDVPQSLREEPTKYGKWLYQDVVYGVSGLYSDNKKKLLILDFADKERQKFERLAAKFSTEQTGTRQAGADPPENVCVEVWRRDQGKCAGCGSREKLEYDHIVPASRGGSKTARNVELLCETCNRSKGDRIQ